MILHFTQRLPLLSQESPFPGREIFEISISYFVFFSFPFHYIIIVRILLHNQYSLRVPESSVTLHTSIMEHPMTLRRTLSYKPDKVLYNQNEDYWTRYTAQLVSHLARLHMLQLKAIAIATAKHEFFERQYPCDEAAW